MAYLQFLLWLTHVQTVSLRYQLPTRLIRYPGVMYHRFLTKTPSQQQAR